MSERRPTDPDLHDTQRKVASNAASIERSARQVERSADATHRSADLTTILAADRTVLAAERTYAAWVRTGLAALASGVGAKTLLQGVLPVWLIGMTGTLLVLFSAFCFAAAVWRALKPGTPPPPPNVRQLPTLLLVLVNGLLILMALATAIGMWL